jgi:proteasome lid subunit RPN8/RPN11
MGLRARNEAVELQRAKREAPRDYLAPDESDRGSWYLPAGTTVTVEREVPELRRRATPTITVSLRESVWQDLVRHASEARDGRETGGFFFGERVRSYAPVSVGRVTRMVTDRRAEQCKLDIGALVAEKGDLRASGADHIVEQGSFHTHPGSDPTPSDTDLVNWLSSLDFLRSSYYVGLILTAEASDNRWWRPNVHGWTVRRLERTNTAVCEPARVVTR